MDQAERQADRALMVRRIIRTARSVAWIAAAFLVAPTSVHAHEILSFKGRGVHNHRSDSFATMENWQPTLALTFCPDEARIDLCRTLEVEFQLLDREFTKALEWVKSTGMRSPNRLGPVITHGDPAHDHIGITLEDKNGFLTTSYCFQVGPRDKALITVKNQGLAYAKRAARSKDEDALALVRFGLVHEIVHAIETSLQLDALNTGSNPSWVCRKIREAAQRYIKERSHKLPEIYSKISGTGKAKAAYVGIKYIKADYKWLSEGIANHFAAKYLAALKGRTGYRLPPIVPNARRYTTSYYGFLPIFNGFFGPERHIGNGYMHVAFFNHLADRYRVRPAALFDRFFTNDTIPVTAIQPADAAAFLQRILAKNFNLGHTGKVLANFYTDHLSKIRDPSRLPPSVDETLWMGRHVDDCHVVQLSAEKPVADVNVAALRPYGARCITVTVESGGNEQSETAIKTYQLQAVSLNKDRQVLDGLHIGRALIRHGGLARRSKERDYVCARHLDRKPGLVREGSETCVIDRKPVKAASDGSLRSLGFKETRWIFPDIAARGSPHVETLTLTFAPTNDGRFSDSFRRKDETFGIDVSLRFTLDLNKAKPDPTRKRPEPDDPDDPVVTQELVRIIPETTAWAGTALGYALFADDPRADRLGELHRELLGEEWQETQRQIFAASFSAYEPFTKGKEALDRYREKDDGTINSFHVQIFDAETFGQVVDEESLELLQDWHITPTDGQRTGDTRPRGAPSGLRWDEMTPGMIFPADLSLRIRSEGRWISTTPGDIANAAPRALVPQGANVTVLDRGDDWVSLQFEASYCETAGGELYSETCGARKELLAEGIFTLLDTYRKKTEDTFETTASQLLYDKDLFDRHPAFRHLRGLDREPSSGEEVQPINQTTGGGAGLSTGRCSCGCDEFEAQVRQSTPESVSDGFLQCADVCCSAYLQCPAPRLPALETLRSACQF